jgi:hypothetical protein
MVDFADGGIQECRVGELTLPGDASRVDLGASEYHRLAFSTTSFLVAFTITITGTSTSTIKHCLHSAWLQSIGKLLCET